MADLERLRLLRRAKDVMDRDWAERIDVDTVAAGAGYSRFHFVRLFKEVYGESPGQYLSRRRVERAQDLLRTANLTITEICRAVGFESLGSFSSRFKQLTGVTPSDYRKAALRDGPPPVPGCFALLWAGGFKVERDPATLEKPSGGSAS